MRAERLKRKAMTVGLPVLGRVRRWPGMIRLGSEYGGWWIPSGQLDAESIVYSAGVGEDISFDTELIESYGCEIVALDPTPRAIAYAEAVAPARFHLDPVGLGGSDRTAHFYSPADATHVSHSIVNLQGTTDYFEAPIECLSTVMRRHGHRHIDLLKMDIEGAEHEVIASMASTGMWPTILCVELDQILPASGTLRSLRVLRRAGYQTAKVEGRNMTFVRRPARS